jgi:hypothetical protein
MAAHRRPGRGVQATTTQMAGGTESGCCIRTSDTRVRAFMFGLRSVDLGFVSGQAATGLLKC